MRRALLIPTVILALIPAPASAQLATAEPRQGFGISFGLGTGSAGVDCSGCSTDRTSGLSGYLRLGGHLRPDLFLGAESSGWVKSQDGFDETVGFYSAVAQWYPNVDRGFYVKGGVGLASYLATDGVDEITGSAVGITAGLGYDFRIGKKLSLTPYANYVRSGKGEVKVNDVSSGFNVSTNILQVGLGLTWH